MCVCGACLDDNFRTGFLDADSAWHYVAHARIIECRGRSGPTVRDHCRRSENIAKVVGVTSVRAFWSNEMLYNVYVITTCQCLKQMLKPFGKLKILHPISKLLNQFEYRYTIL